MKLITRYWDYLTHSSRLVQAVIVGCLLFPVALWDNRALIKSVGPEVEVPLTLIYAIARVYVILRFFDFAVSKTADRMKKRRQEKDRDQRNSQADI